MRFIYILAISGALSAGTGVLAESDSPEPWPEFTFKRVKVPSAKGAGGGATVTVNRMQSEPIKPKPTQAAVATPKPKANATYDWFWTKVPSSAKNAGPERFLNAMDELAKAKGADAVSAPSLGAMLQIAKSQNRDLLLSTVGTNVSPAFALAVIAVESGGKASAQSGAGAQGLMQLMPATAERFGVTDSFDTSQNIKAGVTYLDWLLKEFDQDPVLALAGYNAGENAVKKHGGVPPYPETRDYVPKVLAAYAVARALCKTPPMMVSDGCVFNLDGT